MNCQAARQSLLIDPQRLPATVTEHMGGCDDCRRYQSNVQQLDQLTVRAINQPMRENLAQRVMAAQRLRAARSRVVYGIAASIIAVVFMLALLLPKPHIGNDNEWGALMADHMEEDPLQEEDADPKATERLRSAMTEVGVTTAGDHALHVVRARVCPLGKDVAVHAVFEVNGERVVAFMVHRAQANSGQGNSDQANLNKSSAAMQHKDWQGELLTVNGGTVGVFAHNAAAMQAVMNALTEGVQWQAV